VSELDELFGSRIAEVVPGAIDPLRSAALRDSLVFARHRELERGCYDVAPAPVLDDVVAFASRRTGRALAVAESRVLRLNPGDYLLAHADRVHDGHPIEVVVDLSAAAIPGAEVHYRRRGQVYFRVPSLPGSVAIVERGPTVTSNHTYLSKRQAGSVVRAVLLLR
jgi:hypothetical protein